MNGKETEKKIKVVNHGLVIPDPDSLIFTLKSELASANEELSPLITQIEDLEQQIRETELQLKLYEENLRRALKQANKLKGIALGTKGSLLYITGEREIGNKPEDH